MPTDPLVASAINKQTAMQLAQFTKELAAMGELAVIAGILETSIGTSASAIPYSAKNSLALIAKNLDSMQDTMSSILEMQAEIRDAITDLASASHMQSQHMAEQTSIQSASLADQMVNNAITQAETKAALIRNGIEPQPTPPLKELVKTTFNNVQSMRLSTEVTSVVNNVSDTIIKNTTDYIKNTWLYTQGKEAFASIAEKFGLNKLVRVATNPGSVARRGIKNAVSTETAAGVATPTTPMVRPLDGY